MAAFGRPGAPGITTAALAGRLLPDLSLYVLAGWELLARGTPAEVVFGEMYYSPGWQAVFAVDNSMPLWAVVLATGAALRHWWMVALAGAALLHLAADLALHADDARRHLWPLSDWVFASPVSYWDPAHHGALAAPAEALLVAGLGVWLWRRHRTPALRGVIAVLVLAELAPMVMWRIVFAAA